MVTFDQFNASLLNKMIIALKKKKKKKTLLKVWNNRISEDG